MTKLSFIIYTVVFPHNHASQSSLPIVASYKFCPIRDHEKGKDCNILTGEHARPASAHTEHTSKFIQMSLSLTREKEKKAKKPEVVSFPKFLDA